MVAFTNKPLPEEFTEYLRENGRKGGVKTKERGSDYYRKIGAKGKAKRWGKKQNKAKKP